MLAHVWYPMPDDQERARTQYEQHEEWIKENHHDYGTSNEKTQIAGFLSEICLRRILKHPVFESGKKDSGYDIEVMGLKLDVKNVDGHLYIAERQLGKDRECDGYVFTTYDWPNNTLWVLGWVRKDVFLEHAKQIREGTGAYGRKRLPWKISCRVLDPRILRNMKELDEWPLPKRKRVPEHIRPQKA